MTIYIKLFEINREMPIKIVLRRSKFLGFYEFQEDLDKKNGMKLQIRRGDFLVTF